jgi:hypothetical protein
MRTLSIVTLNALRLHCNAVKAKPRAIYWMPSRYATRRRRRAGSINNNGKKWTASVDLNGGAGRKWQRHFEGKSKLDSGSRRRARLRSCASPFLLRGFCFRADRHLRDSGRFPGAPRSWSCLTGFYPSHYPSPDPFTAKKFIKSGPTGQGRAGLRADAGEKPIIAMREPPTADISEASGHKPRGDPLSWLDGEGAVAPGLALGGIPLLRMPGKPPTCGSTIRRLPKPIVSRSESALGVIATGARTVITMPVTRPAAERLAAATRHDSLFSLSQRMN